MEYLRLFGEATVLAIIFAMAVILISYAFRGSSLVASSIDFVGAYALIRLFMRSHGDSSNLMNMLARSIGVFSITILLERIYSHQPNEFEPIVQYLGQHSGEAILAILCGICAWSLCSSFFPNERIQPMIVAGTTAMAPRKTKVYSKVGPWTKLSEWDAQFIAAHEAGHAIALGLLPYLEKGCHVTLQMGVDADFLDGYCRINGWRNKSQSMTYLKLDLINLLAGVEAEQLCMGERGVSATSDHERFIEGARKYLQCDESSLYFNEPANEHEVKHNTDAIMELKLKYQNIARNLLVENRDILDAIRASLVEKGIVKGEELQKLLSAVKWVPGCPVISPSLVRALKADVEVADSNYQEPKTA